MLKEQHFEKAKRERKSVKCVVWDLDNTLWKGTLLEGDKLKLKTGVLEVLQELDDRGILQSIASRNDYDLAWGMLKAFKIDHFFLYPQIGWTNKSESMRVIAQSLNIGLDTFAFVDDEPYERDEVNFTIPEVITIDAKNLPRIPSMDMMMPRFVTSESKLRRSIYQDDMRRNSVQESFTGNHEAFLSSLHMRLTIREASESDLQRAEELTIRTHQLNTTGYTYSYEELNAFRLSPNHLLLVAELEDKYGSSGTIGLSLVERQSGFWLLRLLIMSCRVMSRGVGGIMLQFIMHLAKENAVKLRAEFISNDRNRMMYVTYKFNGFTEISEDRGLLLLENDISRINPYPAYIQLQLPRLLEAV